MFLQSITQHVILLSVRVILFLFCRGYLLESLYRDLRHLSSGEAAYKLLDDGINKSDDELELSRLPTSSSRSRDLNPTLSPMSAASVTSFGRRLFPSSKQDNRSSFRSGLARALFSLCFEDVRSLHWHIALVALVSLIIFIIPFLECFLFTYRDGSRTKISTRIRAMLTAVPFILYLCAFTYVPLPSGSSAGFSANLLMRINLLGTILLGVLSGFGAVSTAWSFQPFSKSSQNITDRDISSASDALDRVRSDLAARRSEAQRTGALEQTSSWFSTSLFKSQPGSALLLEIDGLQSLETQMARNLESLRRERKETEFRRTWQGRIWGAVGRIFAIYCVFRIISSIRNILFGPTSEAAGTSSPDIITYLIARFAALFPQIPLTPQNIASLSRQISLIGLGVIILSSIRAVLRQMSKLIKSSSRTTGAAFLLLFLAQLMGTYLLSTLIQLRTSFPPTNGSPMDAVEDATPDASPAASEDNLFSSLPEYQLFDTLFDGSFLAAAIVTGAVIWGQRQLNRAEVFG